MKLMHVNIIESKNICDRSFCLRQDFFEDGQIYYYISQDKKYLFWSKSLENLTKHLENTFESLRLSIQSFSFMCQSSFLPRPFTPYHRVFTVPRGVSVTFSSQSGLFLEPLVEQGRPPLGFQFRKQRVGTVPSYSTLLEQIFNSVKNNFDSSFPGFLFHSAGKDSNSIALALAEGGWQKNVVLICHESEGKSDENIISKKLASKMGFKHHTLISPIVFDANDRSNLKKVIKATASPSLDAVTPFYASYLKQIPDLEGSNMIDGGGNDLYMGLPATIKDSFLFRMTRYTSKLRQSSSSMVSGGWLSSLCRTPAESCGITGLSYSDVKLILSPGWGSYELLNSYDYWSRLSTSSTETMSDHEFKSFIVGQIADELHIKKITNFSLAVGANLIMPWADKRVVKYILSWPDEYIIDIKRNRNKPFVRKMLKDMLGLDSDKLGKLGFSVDVSNFVICNWNWILETIIKSPVWEPSAIQRLSKQLNERMLGGGRYSSYSATLLVRLFLLSLWANDRRFFSNDS
jgi:asparagine synthase (glutamine-hydrolysing)